MLRLAIAGLVLTTTALAQEPGAKPVQTSRVIGRVVSDAGLPIAGAIVRLPNLSAVTVVTDANGAFELSSVPPGTYVVNAEKTGYYLANGANMPGPPPPFTVRAGDPPRRLTVSLMKSGAVFGRIVDEFGDPVQQLQVVALRSGFSGVTGQRALMSSGVGDATDDRGEFRLYGLPPGDYVVRATRNPPRDLASEPGVVNPFVPLDTLPVYFPGTRDLGAAQPVSIASGGEASIGFTWRAARALRVSGVVVGPAEPGPMQRIVSLGTANSTGRPVQLEPDGRFMIEGVEPGDYQLQVRGQRGSSTGTLRVSVLDADVSGLVVTTRAPTTIRGRLIYDPPQTRPEFVALSLSHREPTDLISSLGEQVSVEPDGQFVAESTASHVFFPPTRGTWTITEVTLGGEDVFDSGIDLTGKASVEGIRVTVTNRQTTVTGRVTSRRGEAVAGQIVVLMRIDAGQTPLHLLARVVVTDTDGRFEARGLRRGSYVAAAVDGMEGSALAEEHQEWLRTKGYRFSLADGQAVTLDLRPVAGPR